MTIIWDTKADAVHKGDKIREVSPLTEKTNMDENGFTHYVFSKQMFNNPHYVIPTDEFELFRKFINGGSRSYPSDGGVPNDLVGREARIILKEISHISKNPESIYYEDAIDVLKNGTFSLVRGTIKLYLGKYTTRDWRRKRFTDDIDFWVYKINLLDHVLKRNGWIKNTVTREWEKTVFWHNPTSDKREEHIIISSNDINQILDFGAGSYLDGSDLKSILKKKLMRGHDVDLSDILNVAMVLNKAEGLSIKEWRDSWCAFEESINTRSTRISSNVISLIRLSYGIADYLEKVGQALVKYNNQIFDDILFPESEIIKVTRLSVHWQKYLKRHGADKTRELIHNYIFEQGHIKQYYSKNLKIFGAKVLQLLNDKSKYLKITFDIDT
ncbi:MAG: hypothetical protein ACW96X_06290 [Promethearchaeota archaeon]|jgi:hypothetical protein